MSKSLEPLILVVVVSGCSPALSPATPTNQGTAPAMKGTTTPMSTTTETRNRALVKSLYEDCINTGNLSLLSRYVDDDYIGVRGERGVAGFARVIEGLRRGTPDVQFTLEDVLADGARVAVRWTWHGTHQGLVAGVAPTGKRLESTAILIYELRNGKIVQAWLESDRLGFLQRLGVVDPSLGAGPGAPQPSNGASR
jgi:predicted ester cyclase